MTTLEAAVDRFITEVRAALNRGDEYEAQESIIRVWQRGWYEMYVARERQR